MPAIARASKLADVSGLPAHTSLLLLGAVAACAAANGGSLGSGGNGGDPETKQSSHTLTCTIGALDLEIPIELTYVLERPFVAGAAADLSITAAVIFDEAFSAALIDAEVPVIDIMSIDVSSLVLGATPSSLGTSLAEGINDFDLEIDTDDNGDPGPHRIELEATTTATTADEDASEVTLGLSLDGLSLLMGDFQMPADCIDPTLVGFSVAFDVGPPG